MSQINSEHGVLELNAKGYRPDPRLDKIADQMDAGDTEALRHLSGRDQLQAAFYRDARADHRAAVAAGLISDDRPPAATSNPPGHPAHEPQETR